MPKVSHWLQILATCLSAAVLIVSTFSVALAQEHLTTKAILDLDAKTTLSIVALTDQLTETDTELSLQTALQSAGWHRAGEETLSIGNTQKPKWLRLVLRNNADSTIDLRVDTGLPDLELIDIWLLRTSPSATEEIVSLRRNDPYSARSVTYRHIAGEFSLVSNESATLVLRVAHKFQRKMNLRLLSTDAVASEERREAAFSGAFHAVMICMLLLTLASQRVTGPALAMSFAVYLIAAQLMILGWEQQLFRFVFANNRPFDIQFWAAMINLMFAAQLQFGRLLFGLRHIAPRYDRVLLAFVTINVAYALLALVTTLETTQALDPLELPRILGTVALHFGTAIFAWRKGLYGGWAFLVSSAFIALSVLLRALEVLEAESMLDLIRLLFIAESAAFIVALIQRTTGIMRERDTARLAEIDATRRELTTARALNESEHAYTKTRLLADRYATRLATVGHDITQPLSALRLALGRNNNNNPGVTESLDYLEQLAWSESSDSNAVASPMAELIDVRDITDTAVSMFESEAQADGQLFEYEPGSSASDTQVSTSGLALMRVLANLLSNAFRHSNASTVRMSLSHESHLVHIDITDDGIGMDDSTRIAVMERHVRASTSDGQGLGLDIVRDNCQTQGYKLDFQSELGVGTQTRVTLPRHKNLSAHTTK